MVPNSIFITATNIDKNIYHFKDNHLRTKQKKASNRLCMCNIPCTDDNAQYYSYVHKIILFSM